MSKRKNIPCPVEKAKVGVNNEVFVPPATEEAIIVDLLIFPDPEEAIIASSEDDLVCCSRRVDRGYGELRAGNSGSDKAWPTLADGKKEVP